MNEGRLFFMYTGHKPTAHAVHHLRDKCSSNQFRHLEITGQFYTNIRNVSREYIVVTDASTRAKYVMTLIDYHTLTFFGTRTQIYKTSRNMLRRLRLELLPFSWTDVRLNGDTSTPQPGLFIYNLV